MDKIVLHFNKRSRGFTLMEMIVSVGIIAMISGIFFGNYHRYTLRNNLETDAQYFVSKIRETQNYSLSLKEFEGEIPKGGWGVYLSTPQARFAVFADDDGAGMYQNNEQYLNDVVLTGSTTVESVLLDDGGSPNRLSITFKPPDPIVNICRTGSGGCEHRWVRIILRNPKNPGVTKTVTINRAGLIDLSN